MAFTQDVINQAWRRSGGTCECRRKEHSHPLGRCNLQLDPNNKLPGYLWNANHLTAQRLDSSSDGLSNCEILCIACHKATDSYGRH